MKKIFIILGLFSCITGHSQITYNSSDYAAVTDSFHVSKAYTGLSAFDFSQTGANFNWNYATLPVSQQNDIKWMNPVNGGYQNSWCASNSILFGCITQFASYTNLAKYRLDTSSLGNFPLTNVVDHYKISTNTLEYKMQGVTITIGNNPVPIPIQYTNVDTVYNFPMNYMDQDNSKSAFTVDLNNFNVPFRYEAHRKRINQVEGWGSLSTPFGNFSSVLKMKTIIQKSDTIYTDSITLPVIDTLIEYKWFDAAYGIPVLQVNGKLVLGNEIITEVIYIDNLQCIEPTPFFVYTPVLISFDTTTNSAEVDFLNLSSNADSSHWDFGDGNTSILHSPSHTYYCPGLYFVELHVTNEFCIPHLTDSITLPVFILDTNNRLQSFQSITTCDSAQINGNWYFSSQIVLDTLQSLALSGCDSIVVTNLQINNGFTTSETFSICSGDSYTFPDGFTQNSISSATTHQSIFPSSGGCDSVIVTTVNPVTINTTLSVSGNSIIGISGYDNYQWYTCVDDIAVSGANSNTYSPTDTVSYYLEITSGGCTLNSACENILINEIAEYDLAKEINLFPNPNNGIFTLQIHPIENEKIGFQITDIRGRSIQNSYSEVVNGFYQKEFNVNHLEKGIYFLNITLESETITKKIVIR